MAVREEASERAVRQSLSLGQTFAFGPAVIRHVELGRRDRSLVGRRAEVGQEPAERVLVRAVGLVAADTALGNGWRRARRRERDGATDDPGEDAAGPSAGGRTRVRILAGSVPGLTRA